MSRLILAIGTSKGFFPCVCCKMDLQAASLNATIWTMRASIRLFIGMCQDMILHIVDVSSDIRTVGTVVHLVRVKVLPHPAVLTLVKGQGVHFQSHL